MQQTVMNTNTEEFNGGLSTPMQTTIDSSPPSSIPIEGLTLNGIEVEEEQTAEALPTKLKPALTYDEVRLFWVYLFFKLGLVKNFLLKRMRIYWMIKWYSR